MKEDAALLDSIRFSFTSKITSRQEMTPIQLFISLVCMYFIA